MSDFPSPESYKINISLSHLRKINENGIESWLPLIIKKEKYQYVYDIDGNKYIDFFLNNGSTIAGHNSKKLSIYIKNAISTGTETVFLNKSYYRLIKVFKQMVEFKFIQFYNSIFSAFFHLFKHLKPSTVMVSSYFLRNYLQTIFPEIKFLIKPQKMGRIDLYIFEPIDFDGDLSKIDFKEVKAKKYASFENRTAFRISNGFSTTLEDVDFIICGNLLTNGLNSGVIISREKIDGEIIPHYITVSMLESIKYYFRKNITSRFIKVEDSFVSHCVNGIFKISHSPESKELLPFGIILSGNLCFLSIHHTENDIKRLKKALNTISIR